MVVHTQLFVADNPQGTLSNLSQHESLARIGIALELGIVLTQALTAVGFYRLFYAVDNFAAGSLAMLGMEFTQGSKALAAMGGGTPAGESGLRIKVLGKARPGKGKLRLTFSPAGGADVTKVVTIKLT